MFGDFAFDRFREKIRPAQERLTVGPQVGTGWTFRSTAPEAGSMDGCTPASGWEKGQVENQVGLVRERFFTPRLRFKTRDELNAWLLDQCIAYAKAHRHPELTDQTIWDVFEAERPQLVPYAGRFDGFHAVPVSVSNDPLRQ